MANRSIRGRRCLPGATGCRVMTDRIGPLRCGRGVSDEEGLQRELEGGDGIEPVASEGLG